jgi:ribosome recycling factor
MQEEIDFAIDAAREGMELGLAHFERELTKIRAGKANPDMLDGVQVMHYGALSAIRNVATLSVADARTITIQPWEKKMLPEIEQAIFKANLGVTPQSDGQIIRISIPPLNEERRRNLVKQAKAEAEQGKVAIRNVRREAVEDIKKAVKKGYPEDAGKRSEELIQKMTDEFSAKIEKLLEAKEKDILTV